MSKPPEQAFLWGRLPPPPWVSIVGTRRPTRAGRSAAFSLARSLARVGVTILSGGAVGIDSAAHAGALAGGGATLVVAPTWWETSYPKRNRALFDSVVQRGGGYLTLSPESAKPLTHVFFQRNEVLMAMSHAVVLGECPCHSGAKNAMLHARRLLRPRFALPYVFGDDRGRGTWEEVTRHGAEPIVDEAPVLRILEEYGSFRNPKWWEYLGNTLLARASEEARAAPRPRSRRPGTALRKRKTKAASASRGDFEPPEKRAVVDALEAGNQTIDGICQATSLSAQTVQHEIILLLLEGRVSEDGGGLLRYHSPPHE